MKLLLIIALLLIPVVAYSICNITEPDGFTITGTCSDEAGATWTYSKTDGGVVYVLQGTLFCPATPGTYPAVILNHGGSGTPGSMDDLASIMEDWGLIVMAVRLTHSLNDNGTPDYKPDPTYTDTRGDGACAENTLRIMKGVDLLCYLSTETSGSYAVDMNRVAIHGHSAGGWAQIAALDAHTTTFKVASHTGAGTNGCTTTCDEESDSGDFWPRANERDSIITPYSLNHGTNDAVVNKSNDYPNFYDELVASGAPVEYNDLTDASCDSHSDSRDCAIMLANVLDWYTTYGLFDTPTCTEVTLTGVTIQ